MHGANLDFLKVLGSKLKKTENNEDGINSTLKSTFKYNKSESKKYELERTLVIILSHISK